MGSITDISSWDRLFSLAADASKTESMCLMAPLFTPPTSRALDAMREQKSRLFLRVISEVWGRQKFARVLQESLAARPFESYGLKELTSNMCFRAIWHCLEKEGKIFGFPLSKERVDLGSPRFLRQLLLQLETAKLLYEAKWLNVTVPSYQFDSATGKQELNDRLEDIALTICFSEQFSDFKDLEKIAHPNDSELEIHHKALDRLKAWCSNPNNIPADLSLQDNHRPLQRIPQVVSSATRLRTLNLSASGLYTFSLDFSQLPNLRQLVLHISVAFEKAIPGFFPTNVTSVEELTLKSFWGELPANFLNGWDHLTTLTINLNKLETLPPTIFKNKPRLRVVDFECCFHLKTLPKEVFKGAESIEELTLDGGFKEIDEDLLQPLSKLRILKIENCRNLASLPANLLSGNPQLETFFLSNTAVRELDQKFFASQPNLRVIDLRNNQLNTLSPKLFAGLRQLEALHIKQKDANYPKRTEDWDYFYLTRAITIDMYERLSKSRVLLDLIGSRFMQACESLRAQTDPGALMPALPSNE